MNFAARNFARKWKSFTIHFRFRPRAG